MASFSELIIAGYPTFTMKNEYSDEIVNLIFQPQDYISEPRALSTRNKLVWGDSYENNDHDFVFKGFKQTVGNCKKRLELFGTNLKSVRKDFNIAKKKAAEGNYFYAEYEFPIGKVPFKVYYDQLRLLLQTKEYDFTGDRDSLKSVLMIDGLYIGGQKISESLYALFSVLDDDEIIEYDLTEIIDGGWIKNDVYNSINYEKIIVLTEGRTDATFISKSLDLLHPELHPYYHFMDFEGFKVEGGASALVKTIKSFAAANIKHPIIAIFDNDTAGIAEMKLLPVNLPKNIRIFKLPDITLAKKYPTVGPSGEKIMNINGLACGIEMYLGSSILKQGGVFPRIRWKNFNDRLQQYHGTLENKSAIQESFLLKISQGEIWEMPEMRLLLSRLFSAFQN